MYKRQLMNSVNDYVMMLLPTGVLVMSTYTFGTLNLMKFKGLLLYILASIFYLVFISMVIYPGILASVSKINYSKFFHYTMPAALIAFTTGSVFLSLPVIYNQMYKLSDELKGFEEMGDNYLERGRNAMSIVVPLAWVVPASYKFLVIFFIIFAHWYYDRTFPVTDQLMYFIGGIPCLFGSNSVVVPFLLQAGEGLPVNQAYDIFMLVSSFLVYFNNANGSIFIIVATILCYLSLCNKLKIRWIKLIIIMAVSTLSFIVVVGALSFVMTKLLAGDDEVKDELTHMNVEPYNTHYYQEISVSYLNLSEYKKIEPLTPDEPLLDKVQRTRILQVGYDPQAIPFSFFNGQGKLVGYDIDFVYDIAENMRCKNIEFYAVNNFNEYQDCLTKGILLDMCVGGYVYMGCVEGPIITSDPYMKYTPAIVIPMKYKEAYPDFVSIFTSKDMTIGFRVSADYKVLMYERPLIGLSSFKEYYTKHTTDALLTSAEIASAISIVYHGYWVYYYEGSDIKLFYAYLLPYKDNALTFRNMVNAWIATGKWDGTALARYEYWIMGEADIKVGETWSVLSWLKKHKYFLGDKVSDRLKSLN